MRSSPATAAALFLKNLLVALAICCWPAPATGAGIGTALLAQFDLSTPVYQHKLPKHLRELSGLALIGGTRVVLHDDNLSTMFAFDYARRRPQPVRILPSFTPIRGDFEGIAIARGLVHLMSSRGELFRFENQGSQPRSHQPEFLGRCNFEGLAANASGTRFYIPCKYPGFETRGKIHLFIAKQPFDADTSSTQRDHELIINVAPVLAAYRLQRLRPSAVEWLDDSTLLVLAGKERVLLEISTGGKLYAWRRLNFWRHRQAEGVTIGGDGSLVIADEGRWFGGTVTVYGRNKTNPL